MLKLPPHPPGQARPAKKKKKAAEAEEGAEEAVEEKAGMRTDWAKYSELNQGQPQS